MSRYSLRRRPGTQPCHDNSSGTDGQSDNSAGISDSTETLSTQDGQQDNGGSIPTYTREILQQANLTNTRASSAGNQCGSLRTLLIGSLCRIPCSVIEFICSIPCIFSAAYTYAKSKITMDAFWCFTSIAIIIFGGIYCGCQSRRADYLIRKEKYEEELKALWQSQVLLDEQFNDLNFVKKEVENCRDSIKGFNKGIRDSVKQVLEHNDISGDDKNQMMAFINKAFKKISEDHIQMADWALKSLGATIDHSRTSKTYDPEKAQNCWLGWFFISSANPPETILEPDVNPGNCWPLEGSEGQVVVKLPEEVYARAVTVQHISKVLSPSGEISSAMKDFKVFGINDDNDNGTPLGTFTYDIDKEAIQTFTLENNGPEPFRYIKFQVKSNWGHPNFTCIYRVRVHGKMARDLDSKEDCQK